MRGPVLKEWERKTNIKLLFRWNFRLLQRVHEAVLVKSLTDIIWYCLACDQYLEQDSQAL